MVVSGERIFINYRQAISEQGLRRGVFGFLTNQPTGYGFWPATVGDAVGNLPSPSVISRRFLTPRAIYVQAPLGNSFAAFPHHTMTDGQRRQSALRASRQKFTWYGFGGCS